MNKKQEEEEEVHVDMKMNVGEEGPSARTHFPVQRDRYKQQENTWRTID